MTIFLLCVFAAVSTFALFCYLAWRDFKRSLAKAKVVRPPVNFRERVRAGDDEESDENPRLLDDELDEDPAIWPSPFVSTHPTDAQEGDTWVTRDGLLTKKDGFTVQVETNCLNPKTSYVHIDYDTEPLPTEPVMLSDAGPLVQAFTPEQQVEVLRVIDYAEKPSYTASACFNAPEPSYYSNDHGSTGSSSWGDSSSSSSDSGSSGGDGGGGGD